MPGGNSREANIGRVFDFKGSSGVGVKASCWEWAGTIAQVPGIGSLALADYAFCWPLLARWSGGPLLGMSEAARQSWTPTSYARC